MKIKENKLSSIVEGIDYEILYSDNAVKQNLDVGDETDVSVKIIDVNGDSYQSDIHLLTGWSQKDLTSAITTTLTMLASGAYSLKVEFLGKIL